jgi:predicted PurR-regulated permease PerM
MTHAEFTNRAARVIGLVLLAASLAAVVVLAADVLLVLFGGILLAVFFRGVADFLAGHSPLSPRLALAVVLLLFFALAITGGWLLAAELANQLDQLGGNLNDLWHQVQTRLRQEPWGRQLLTFLKGAQVGGLPQGGGGGLPIAQAFSTTLGGVANLFIILFVGIYLAVDPGWYRRGLLRLVPQPQRARAVEIMDAIGHALRWWLFGRAVSMVIVGALTGIGLALIGVPLALALGVIAGAFDFVPFVGPIAAAAPGILIALSKGLTQVGYVVALYAAIQFFEGYILTPMVEQRSVKLPPALTIAAQVLLGVLIGGLGVVFATPLLAVLVIVVKRLYVLDTLEHAADG